MFNLSLTEVIEKILSSNRFIKYFNLLLSVFSIGYLINLSIENNLVFNLDYKLLVFLPILWFAYFLFSLAWTTLINNNKIEKLYIYIWFNSIIGKYLPFKIGIPLMRITDTHRSKATFESKKNIKSLVVEHLLNFSWGFYIGILYFLPPNLLKANTLAISFLFGFLLIYIFKKLNKYFMTNLFVMLGQYLNILFFSIVYFQMFGVLDFQLIFAYYFSTVISMIFIGAPAGLGIREFIYLKLLNNMTNTPEILAFAISIRIVFIINDLLLSTVSKAAFSLDK